MKVPRLRTLGHLAAALLFSAFAFFQVNDIDPEIYYNPSVVKASLWFAFYLAVAAFFLISLFRTLPAWVLVVAMLACLVQMALTGPGLYQNLFGGDEFNMTQVSMSAEDPRVEMTREFFGALIALGALVYLFCRTHCACCREPRRPEQG